MKSIINRRRACANSGSNGIVFVDYIDNINSNYIDIHFKIQTTSNLNSNITFSILSDPSLTTEVLSIPDERSMLFNLSCIKENKSIKGSFRYGRYSVDDFLLYRRDINTINLSSSRVIINGVEYQMTHSTHSDDIKNMYIAYSKSASLSIRFYKADLYDGASPIVDLYPCRIDTGGYVYDKISKTVFGDGSWVPGPDSTNQTPWINN